MTTSGTYAFSSSAASSLTLVSFGRIGIKRTELTSQHLADAAIEANLVQVTLGGNQPNLWKSEVYPLTLTVGVATYDLPARMIAIQDIYMSTSTSGGPVTDRILAPVSLYEYDAQANKTQQAVPTLYVIKKTLSPTITFWPVPDSSSTYIANVRMLIQSQDVTLASGATLDIPYIYMDTFVAGLAHRLSRHYAPDKEALRERDYDKALEISSRTDTQDSVGLYVSPDFSGYYRR